MPNKWGNHAMYTLLLKLVEQNPSCLSNYDKEKICSTWPAGSEPPTTHMVRKLVTKLRRIVDGGCNVPKDSSFSRTLSTPTPTTTTSSKKRPVAANKQSTGPVTPTKRPLSTNNTTTSRRVTPKTSRTSTPSTSNKPKPKKPRNGNTSDSESVASSLVSSESAPDNDSSDSNSDNDSSRKPSPSKHFSTARRTLPQRSKSRQLSYAVTAGSSGEDEAAREIDSGDEFRFSDASVGAGNNTTSKSKGKARREALREAAMGKSGSSHDAAGNDGDGDVKMEDGLEKEEMQERGEIGWGRRLSANSEEFHDVWEDAAEGLEG